MNTDVTNAILRGLETAADEPNKTLIHLSGTGNFIDHRHDGKFVAQAESEVWNDANPNHVRKISKDMSPNGPCDELILQAAAKGDVDAYFVCPAGIYGSGTKNALRLDREPAGAWVGEFFCSVQHRISDARDVVSVLVRDMHLVK